MFSMAKILFPVDFSERSAFAAQRVESLARQFGSVVTMVHVLPPPHYEFSALEVGGTVLNELFANRAAQVSQELNEYAAAGFEGIAARRLLLEGDPARRIVEQAAADGSDVIVMPTHGYGSFRRFILGSVTAKVLHDADCPVWTGAHIELPPGAKPAAIRTVLCGVDLGPQSGKAIEWASSMAQACGASLAIAHAIPVGARGGDEAQSECARQMRDEAGQELQKLLEKSGVERETRLLTGDAPKEICELAARMQANLLVIGRGSAAGVFGRLRTNAYAIIRQSPCPVVSV